VKLLLDEMLSPEIAEILHSRGHDVEAIKHSPHERLPDPEVVDLARAQERAIVTNNVRDYRPLHAAAVVPGGQGHYGMIFMSGAYRRTKADTGRIADALEAKLRRHSKVDSLKDAEDWL
jgi:hypothetical protein